MEERREESLVVDEHAADAYCILQPVFVLSFAERCVAIMHGCPDSS